MSLSECDDFRIFIDPYLDGEFAERERAQVDGHLANCEECGAYFEQRRWLQSAVKPSLQKSCQLSTNARIRLEQKLRTAQRPMRAKAVAKKMVRPLSAVALVGALFLLAVPLTGFKNSLVKELVALHCRDEPVEVPTPEVGEVDNWFKDKLPFRVTAPQFKDQRVMLLGGRLSQVRPTDQQIASPAAAITYRVSGHKMSIHVFEAQDTLGSDVPEQIVDGNRVRLLEEGGYRVALMRRGNLTYAVTSTLPKAEMLGLLGTSH
jgi:anti-sigma factor RsiW